ncbi:periostin-like isoform X2 [Centruroides vittatus]|uniref:periostin-like isoform X2 n=1 Tax=Centruroides vittatus TaxID=120091 RepID=UPI003510A21D
MEITLKTWIFSCLLIQTLALWQCRYYPDELLIENPNTGEWTHQIPQIHRTDYKKVNSSPPDNVLKVLEKLGLTQILEYMKQTGLDEGLSGEGESKLHFYRLLVAREVKCRFVSGPFTVFAPTNHSFEVLNKEIKDNLTGDNQFLRRVLQYHVIPERKMSWHLKTGACLQTLIENTSVAITYTWHNRVRVNDAPILLLDVEGKNGVVHVIEDVLIPPDKTGCPYKEYQQPHPQYIERGYEHPPWNRAYGPVAQELPNYYPGYPDFGNYQHG